MIGLRGMHGQRGMATLTVMILTVVITSITYYLASMALGYHRAPVENYLYSSAVEIVKANIAEVSSNPTAWSLTVANGSNTASLGCVRSGSGVTCPAGFDGTGLVSVELYDPAGALYASNTTAAQGFKLSGEKCSTYSATDATSQASQGCVLKPNVRWRPFCNAACYVSPPQTTPPYVQAAFSAGGTVYNRGFFYITVSTAVNATVPAKDGYKFSTENNRLWGMPIP